jgi:hypothetical protein
VGAQNIGVCTCFRWNPIHICTVTCPSRLKKDMICKLKIKCRGKLGDNRNDENSLLSSTAMVGTAISRSSGKGRGSGAGGHCSSVSIVSDY